MAIRKLRFKGDEILTKKARKIEVIDGKIKELAQDMLDTMYANSFHSFYFSYLFFSI